MNEDCETANVEELYELYLKYEDDRRIWTVCASPSEHGRHYYAQKRPMSFPKFVEYWYKLPNSARTCREREWQMGWPKYLRKREQAITRGLEKFRQSPAAKEIEQMIKKSWEKFKPFFTPPEQTESPDSPPSSNP